MSSELAYLSQDTVGAVRQFVVVTPRSEGTSNFYKARARHDCTRQTLTAYLLTAVFHLANGDPQRRCCRSHSIYLISPFHPTIIHDHNPHLAPPRVSKCVVMTPVSAKPSTKSPKTSNPPTSPPKLLSSPSPKTTSHPVSLPSTLVWRLLVTHALPLLPAMTITTSAAGIITAMLVGDVRS